MSKQEYITAKEAILILEVAHVRTLQRYKEKYNIKTKDMGAGKAKLYLKSDIEQCKIDKQKNSKHTPKKIKEKSIQQTEKKKEATTKRIEKNEKSKEQAKKDLATKEFNPLSEIGQAEYLRVEQQLIKNGTFEEMDSSILLAYAVAYQGFVTASYESKCNNNTTTDEQGNEKVHPQFTIADKFLTQMTKLSNMLGLSVRARIGLDIHEKPTGFMADILNKRNK